MSDEFQQRRDREMQRRLEGFTNHRGPGFLAQKWQDLKNWVSDIDWDEFLSGPEDPPEQPPPGIEPDVWEQARPLIIEQKQNMHDPDAEPNEALSVLDQAVEGGADPFGDEYIEGEIPEQDVWNSNSPEARPSTEARDHLQSLRQEDQIMSTTKQRPEENEIEYESDMIDVPTDENGYYIDINYQPSDGPARTEQPELKPVQQKLANLGYYDDDVDGLYGDNTRRAVEQFIADHNVQGNPEYISEEVYREIMNARQ